MKEVNETLSLLQAMREDDLTRNVLAPLFGKLGYIISSRDCIAEIADIQFLGITLLPFTQPQIKRFIEGWNP